MLANYVIKPFKWDHTITMTLVIITLDSCVRFALGIYVLKPHKWNKEKVTITFGSYVKIMLESCVRLTWGSYAIKPCKWDQKNTQ